MPLVRAGNRESGDDRVAGRRLGLGGHRAPGAANADEVITLVPIARLGKLKPEVVSVRSGIYRGDIAIDAAMPDRNHHPLGGDDRGVPRGSRLHGGDIAAR
jgi:hypothetical protein